MLDIAWPELVVIGAVALVAIGPKDMPRVMHALGRWVGRARRMAQEFHRTFEQLEYEAEIADRLKKQSDSPHAAHAPQNPSPSAETPPPTASQPQTSHDAKP